MFFRRETPKTPTFQERMDKLARAGFRVTSLDGGVRVSRENVAITVERAGEEVSRAARAGVLIGDEIAFLVDAGYQKLFRTPSGKTRPAMAQDLAAIHDFEEDLKDALGLISLYNESLGTVSTFYLYDRVQNRDRGVPKRVWE